ncbi:sugar-binding transcriptional regulator [Arthrobacter sp. zg-ZUI100]|uniref:Sugar-binding transcriptional regulator n=1 Tax=Arthrobacter jiangjiafuii TaxID=2817475 RepID=A0A975R111_9MICC|nr:sugar-binding transcriptional regulator [Arthrobacter jiangjiafuii]MBP3037400.1 sugar-binding transcriptional regulator [Arthrobacter jiangjiafuii]MBP3043744.1 sugar-binding transcriptional regulator [Arthrobacter jiangjiafuii]QWC10772.1 sugar-binding transcriptional regulator [Arthrobacter jiangjiafuii]
MDARDEQSLDAIKLYYDEGLSQSEVAQRLGLSRPTVSKLIQYGKDRGYVTITIHDPRERESSLAAELRAAFGLQEVRLAVLPENGANLSGELGKVGAAVLTENVTDGDLVGVTWGETMYAVAKNLSHQERRGVEIIQLKGGVSYTTRATNDFETITLFCNAFGAFARTLPLPVIFESLEVKRLVEGEKHIRRVIEMGREADVAVFTVGAIRPDAMLFNLGYLSETEKAGIAARAVGDICSRFFDDDGNACVPQLDERTVGITLEDLRGVHTRLLVAGGEEKVQAIEAALRAGFATHLVVDQDTARKVLHLTRQRAAS